jgi:hypothetical protein
MRSRDSPGFCREVDIAPAGEGEFAAALRGEQQNGDRARHARRAQHVIQIGQQRFDLGIAEDPILRPLLATRAIE